jgi:hypothetical protein
MNAGLCDIHAVCVSVIHIISTGIPKPIFIKLGMYVTTTEHISTAYYINSPPSLQSFCGSVRVSLLSLLGKWSVKCIPQSIAKQRLGRQIPAATNTLKNRIVGSEFLWVCVALLCYNSLKTFLLQGIIIGDLVFYAVRVVSRKIGD